MDLIPRRNARGKRWNEDGRRRSGDAVDAYAAVAGEDGPSAGRCRKTRGERGGLRMDSQCRHEAGFSSCGLLLRRLAEYPIGCAASWRQQPGQNDSLWRRAAAASNRPLPGAGAALILYHRYFLAKQIRTASDLAVFRPAVRAKAPLRCASPRASFCSRKESSALSRGSTTIISE